MTAAPLIHLRPEKRQFRTQGVECATFIETFLILGTGDSYGEPFLLRPWQKKLLNKMLEIIWEPDQRRWRRRYTSALLGLPTGSGKTPFAAAVAMWFLMGGQHKDPSIAVAAASKEQAGLVFGNAITMAEGPKLSKFLETGRDQIVRREGRGRLYRVSAADGTNDGQIITCLIKDEYHEWAETKNTDAILTKATAKVRDPFELAITTAGWNLDTICGRLYQHGKAVERGDEIDEEFLFHWVEADEDADPDDEEVWRKVHPAIDDFISMRELRTKRKKLGTLRFQRYYLNRWVGAIDAWLENGAWDACRVAPEEVEFDAETPAFIGWDGSRSRDSTAVVAVQRCELPLRNAQGEPILDPVTNEPVLVPRVRVKPMIWDRPRNMTGQFDETWRVNQNEVMDYIREQCGLHNVQAAPYDPALIEKYASDLEDEGLPMLSFPQSPQRMTEATGMLEALIADVELAHDGDEKLARHIGNAAYEPMRGGGGRLVKGRKEYNKMDGAIALAMAVWALMKHEEAEPPADVDSMLVI